MIIVLSSLVYDLDGYVVFNAIDVSLGSIERRANVVDILDVSETAASRSMTRVLRKAAVSFH